MYGNIYMCNSINEIHRAIAENIIVIAISDNIDEFRYTQCFTGSILLPPYESVSMEIDGDRQSARLIYLDYLKSPNPIMFIMEIVSILHRGQSIMLYVEPEPSMEMCYARTLIEFFQTKLGIGIGDGCGFGFNINPTINMNPIYESTRLDLMYGLGGENILPFNQFCLEYPNGVIPSEPVCCQIRSMTNLNFSNMDEFRIYCAEYIKSNRERLLGRTYAVSRMRVPG